MTKIRIPTMLLGIMFLLLACGKNVDSEIQAENISKAESEKHLETTGHQPGHRWIPNSIFSVQKREKARGYKPLTW